MKHVSVDTVTTNERHVRLKIYDGDLNVSDAARELIRIERVQADALRAENRRLKAKLAEAQQ